MKAAFVGTNILDMRERPDHHSERVNQLLFAEPVAVLRESRGFANVRRWDGYEGWADARFLTPVSRRRLADYARQTTVTVRSLQTLVRSADTRSRAPHVLFYGTRMALKRMIDGWAELLLPDGAAIRVRASAVQVVPDAGSTSGSDIVREACRFLGVPYLWGGITSPGLDCSGLVQTVYRRFGYDLPRDTKDQISVGKKVERSRVERGDLLFFTGHVAIVLAADSIIHSSRGGGGVRIESLDPDDPACRLDLVTSFKEARRIS